MTEAALSEALRLKAISMGAVDLVVLTKPERAGPGPQRSEYHGGADSGTVLRFTPRTKPSRLTPPVFEDPRWADLHQPD